MKVSVVILGAGQAGLAMSRSLSRQSIDHVIIERGEVANSWRNERWDSLRLLTPNWQTRLPDYQYGGTDPDGFMTMPETAAYLESYAMNIKAPVVGATRVTSVKKHLDGYAVYTDAGVWQCQCVVIATGACNIASVPAIANELPSSINQLTPMNYRSPDCVNEGAVLVVGASASGTQIARELAVAGRQVHLAVGEHVRVPRSYRGHDIKYWMDKAGVLDDFISDADDYQRARRVPSLQLMGSDARHDVDINALTRLGINASGRLVNVRGEKLQFSGALANHCTSADLKLSRLLDRIDEYIASPLCSVTAEPGDRPAPTQCPASPSLELSLSGNNITNVIWATGFRPDYSWLDVPVLDRKGRVQHNEGVVTSPGMYLLGMPFLRRRNSNLIDGVGDDAIALSYHLKHHLETRLIVRSLNRDRTTDGQLCRAN